MNQPEEKEKDKRFSLPIDQPQIVWQQCMDLIGVYSTSDQIIEVHRVGFKHQKVFSKQELVGPTSLGFTENGKYLIVGYQDGKISILNSDNADEIFSTKIEDNGCPITSIHWQESVQQKQIQIKEQDFSVHLKDFQNLDPKIKSEIVERVSILQKICESPTTNILFCSDASLRIIILFGGFFPISCFNIKDILPPNTFANNLIVKIKKLSSTDDCDQLMTLGQVYNSDSVSQGQFLMNIDTRIIPSRILNQETYLKIFRDFPLIEENIKYLDSKVEVCKNYWKTYHKQHLMILNLLKPQQQVSTLKPSNNPITEELIETIVRGKMSQIQIKFFTEEVYNCKSLQRLDENSQLVFGNIQEEIQEKMIPAIERTLIILSELRGIVKAKQIQFGNQISQMYFGLNESIIQKLIDSVAYYYNQVQLLQNDIIEAKINVRNMLVYFNHIVLKLAVANPANQNVNPQEIENTKSNLAKLSPDTNSLLEYLQNGDSHILLMDIQKHLEEGQYKMPLDGDNQIVQDFNSEDLLQSLRMIEEQETAMKKQKKEQYQQQMVNVQSVSQQNVNNKRTTRRQHLQSSDFSRGTQNRSGTSQLATITPIVEFQRFHIIPLKTLSTRILDLIHKQIRKPIETMSSYYRYTQQIYFENSQDQVLDMLVTKRQCKNRNHCYFTYKIDSRFLMLVQYSLRQKNRDRIRIEYQFIQIPEGYQIKECVFHMNSLSLRQTGLIQEEVLLMAESDDETNHVVKVLDLNELIEQASNEQVCMFDHLQSFKFGLFAREALQISLNEDKVIQIDFEERKFCFESQKINGLKVGTKGIYSLIQDQREIIIQEFE